MTQLWDVHFEAIVPYGFKGRRSGETSYRSGETSYRDKRFVMRAPMVTIVTHYDLHGEAVKRIERAGDEPCVLHLTRGAWTGRLTVVRATNSLGPTNGD